MGTQRRIRLATATGASLPANRSPDFPTLYRANRMGKITSLAHDAGLEVCSYERFMGRPGYLLTTHWLLFLLGHLAHRFIDTFLPWCRNVLMVQLKKPA